MIPLSDRLLGGCGASRNKLNLAMVARCRPSGETAIDRTQCLPSLCTAGASADHNFVPVGHAHAVGLLTACVNRVLPSGANWKPAADTLENHTGVASAPVAASHIRSDWLGPTAATTCRPSGVNRRARTSAPNATIF